MKVWLLILDMGSIIIWNACGIGARDKKKMCEESCAKIQYGCSGYFGNEIGKY
jgi:hypothetical protein